jgi:ABC-type transporter Mla maintaining outer membrane lipid asymmetry permease subunit MlaE
VIGERALENIGAGAIRVAQEVGGIVVLTGQVLRARVPPRIDGRELVKNLYKMGNRSTDRVHRVLRRRPDDAAVRPFG